MTIGGISNLMMKAGGAGGIDAIESRIKQIEGKISSIEGQGALPTTGAQPALPLNPLTGGEFTTAPVGKQPFQFYLQSAQKLGAPATATPVATAGGSTNPIIAGNGQAQAFQPLIEQLSARYQVDKNLVNALIKQESGFNPNAVSSAGAQGLMQLMPQTAQGLGVNPQDPVQNLEGGIRHLSGLLQQFNGNIPLALAAYNAGAGAVNRYKGIPPYKETQNYVRNILSMYLKAKQEEA